MKEFAKIMEDGDIREIIVDILMATVKNYVINKMARATNMNP